MLAVIGLEMKLLATSLLFCMSVYYSSVAEANLLTPDETDIAFDSVLYETIYNVDQEIHTIASVFIEVTEGALVMLEGALSSYFLYDPASKVISLQANLPHDLIWSLPYVSVKIVAIVGTSITEAVLIVTMPRIVNVEFDKIFYETIYNNEAEFHTINPVTIEVTEGATITLEGDFNHYFDYDDASKSIILISNLPDNLISSLYYINLRIKATMVSSFNNAVLTVVMPDKVSIQFDRVLYETHYNNEQSIHKIDPVAIQVTEKATITLEGDFSSYFEYNSASQTISLIANLPDSLIWSLHYVDVKISAKVDTNIAKAVLIVAIPGKVNVEFNEVLYETNYNNEEANHTIDDVTITVTEGATITLKGDFSPYFGYDSESRAVSLIANLPDNLISFLQYINVGITATVGTSSAEAVLIVAMPIIITVGFDKVLYETDYDNGQENHAIYPVTIGVTDGAIVRLQGDFNRYFGYNPISNTITLTANLPESLITFLPYIDIKITATIGSTIAEAVLIVTMPSKANVQFNRVLYETIYNSEQEFHFIYPVLIEITDEATITLEGAYKEYFQYSADSKYIALKENLPDNVITSLCYIEVGITATIGSAVAESALIVSMPFNTNVEFKRLFYDTDYSSEEDSYV